MTDRRIREWTLHEEVGRGGMGVVYRATHRYMSGDWAVKVMRPELVEDEESRARFLSEVTVLSSLQHPGIVRIHAPFEEVGQLYLPMEYLTGLSLDAALKAAPGPWAPARAAAIVRAAAEAVGYAHRRMPVVIHRDIKPLNIQLLEDGECKVMDFGLARMLGEKSMTATGKAVGTPAYMAPEVLDGQKSTPQSDVYSLGVVLYRMLAGRLPYDLPEVDSSLLALLMAVGRAHESGLPDVRKFAPDIPPALAALAMRALSRDQADRPADGAEFAALLGSVSLRRSEETGDERPLAADADMTALAIDLNQAKSVAGISGSASRKNEHLPDADRSLLDINVGGTKAATGVATLDAPDFGSVLGQNSRKRNDGRRRRILLPIVVVAMLAISAAASAVWWFGVETPRRAELRAADLAACDTARQEDTSDAWKKYSSEFSVGMCHVEAAAFLGDAEACEAARRVGTVEKWREYLGTTPGPGRSKLVCEAEARGVINAIENGTVWIRIPGGTFQMGSDDEELCDSVDMELWCSSKPVHSVTVPTFEMAKTETTVAQYRKCVEVGACTAPTTGEYCNWGKSGRDNNPVNCVDWNQAAEYAKWVGGRLPTEAEWEYAARSGGGNQKYPWGDQSATCAYAVMDDGSRWTDRGCGKVNTWSVCSKTAGNTLHGLCDMSGNAWEWVQDDWQDNYSGAPTDGSAWKGNSDEKVFRGGNFMSESRSLYAAFRVGSFCFSTTTGKTCNAGDVGFRPARDVR